MNDGCFASSMKSRTAPGATGGISAFAGLRPLATALPTDIVMMRGPMTVE